MMGWSHYERTFRLNLQLNLWEFHRNGLDSATELYNTTLIQGFPRDGLVSLRAEFPAQSPVEYPLLHKLLP